jgi:hypothetical protein
MYLYSEIALELFDAPCVVLDARIVLRVLVARLIFYVVCREGHKLDVHVSYMRFRQCQAIVSKHTPSVCLIPSSFPELLFLRSSIAKKKLFPMR